MKLMKYFLILVLFFTVALSVRAQVLTGSVVHVPDAFFGAWRVVSHRISTDSPAIFQEKGVDLWNISLENDVIKFSNPISGAVAELDVKESGLNHVTFTKKGKYDNKLLIDTVSINIEGDTFAGENILVLETLSDVDGKVIKTETAKYKLNGERLSGQNVRGN